MTMFYRQNDIEGIRNVKGVHEGKGSINIRSFFDGKSQLGIGFHVWELKPGTSEGTHIHEKESALEEIYYFLEGQGEMWIGTETINVKAGDAILVPPGVEHGFKNSGLAPLKLVLLFGKPIGVDSCI